MGGLGSGNWFRWQGSKATVEQSLALAVSTFGKRLYPHSTGTITWTPSRGKQSSIGYEVTWNGTGPRIRLHYRLGDAEDIEIPVQMQSTPTHFGGERWWFTCPLIVNGVECGRRVGKLYLPGGAKYFGCRNCHRLTYRSCQESHSEERAARFEVKYEAEIRAFMARLNRD